MNHRTLPIRRSLAVPVAALALAGTAGLTTTQLAHQSAPPKTQAQSFTCFSWNHCIFYRY
jgi:hypothetical protein